MATRNSLSTVLSQPPMRRVSRRLIRSLATQIAKDYNPERIILFGSHAYGNPSPTSDIDLLVVMDAFTNQVELALEMVKSLPPQPFSIDLLVRSQETIDNRIAQGDWFLKEIIARGIVLYERNHARMGP